MDDNLLTVGDNGGQRDSDSKVGTLSLSHYIYMKKRERREGFEE